MKATARAVAKYLLPKIVPKNACPVMQKKTSSPQFLSQVSLRTSSDSTKSSKSGRSTRSTSSSGERKKSRSPKPMSKPEKPRKAASADSVQKDGNQKGKAEVQELLPSFPNFKEKVLKNDLDCLNLSSMELGTIAAQLLGQMFETGLKTSPISIRKYVMEIMASWPIDISNSQSAAAPAASSRISVEIGVPSTFKYHGFALCVDTLNTIVKLTHPTHCNGRKFILPEEAWALGISALGSCAGHTGRDSAFLSASGSKIADLYGDSKPTARHSVAITLQAVRKYGMLKACLVEESERRCRHIIINSMMNSDWGDHPMLASKFGELVPKVMGTNCAIESPEDRSLLCTMLLHTAIVSHSSKNWPVAARWAAALHEEFLSQGDELKSFGHLVPPHMDRHLASLNTLSVSNIDNFALPSLNLLAPLVPKISSMISTTQLNRTTFADKYREGGDRVQAQPWSSRASVDKFHSIVMPEDAKMLESVRSSLSPSSVEMAPVRGKSSSALKGPGAPNDIPENRYKRLMTQVKPIRKQISVLVESGRWQFISFTFTILALFLDLLRDATLKPASDESVNFILTLSLFFFMIEITLMCLASGRYFGSFFFYLDVAGTVSLVLDVPYVFNAIGLGTVSSQVGLASGAGKAARGARAARAAKMARLVRLIRLARFVRLLKYFASLGGDKNVDDGQSDAPSRIGQILAEQMSQRVVLLVLLVLFIGPLLNAERTIDFPLAMTLTCMEYLDNESLNQFIDDHYNNLEFAKNSNFRKVVYLEVHGDVLIKADDSYMRGIRTYPTDNEIYTVNSIPQAGCLKGDTNCTITWFDDRPFHQEEGVFGIFLILFMVFLLSLGSWMFVGISRRLVVAPIERMFKVIDIVSISLNSLKDKKETIDDDDVDDSDVFETSFLEEAVLKMAELLNMGYGAAGAEIIQRNLGLSGGSSVETFMAGQRMEAIFAFCDIRKFTNTTEILQENVLRFVNLIGHVVHSNTMHFEGAPNKNIGDAFLLVWKVNNKEGGALNKLIPKTSAKLFPGFDSVKDTSAAVTIGDGALKAMVQTCYDLHHVNTVPTWELERQLVELNILPPDEGQQDEERELSKGDEEMIKGLIHTLTIAGRKVSMGYGLHFGWAIEGAIGSTMKIDASYLSPHVNTAARLEAATKQFGATILMSHEFILRLSDENQNLCRRIDSVFLVGKADPTALYTWDFWTGPNLDRNHPLSPLSKLGKAPPGSTDPASCTPYEYCKKFEDGEQAYEDGDWARATKRLFECQKILHGDYPARSLITVMSRFNFVAPPDWHGSRQLTEK